MPRDANARREALVLGARVEALVAEALAGAGWTILARNWSGGGGELDVVAERSGEVRFVEVKARDLDDPLSDEAVTATKRTRLRRAARLWLEQHDEQRPAAFLVAVVDPRELSIRWVDDAFDG